MWTTSGAAVAALDRVGASGWAVQAGDLLGRVARHAARRETGRRLGMMITALLGDVGRKNCWTLAEAAGEGHPWGMQHLLGRAVWDTDAVAAELRAFVGEHLRAPEAVLIVDETGDAKKGSATVGVQRQYSGTTGRIENCQVAVHLAYASARGHALIDRELGVPPARSVGETCHGRGRTTRRAAPRRGCHPRSPSRPSRRWLRR